LKEQVKSHKLPVTHWQLYGIPKRYCFGDWGLEMRPPPLGITLPVIKLYSVYQYSIVVV
jgi:hypothetical protein